MDTVTIDRNLAVNLINAKLRLINEAIEEILTRWNYDSSQQLIDDARTGIIEEAEDDAIGLRQLLLKREELFQLKGSWTND
ncbi:MAG: hypothetical protein ACTSYA_04980 [Candidatus Kariarchaeaceae archaeon]